MNAGKIIAQTLKLYGIEYFFAFSGGGDDIWLGLRDVGIQYILPHNERSAVIMADAYSRITGRPSFTHGMWGPAAAICVGGLVDAYWAQSPVICLTSTIPSAGMHRYDYQAIEDQQSLFAPITKWNAVVANIARLPDMLRNAIRMAMSGAPGPVHIDIPVELTFTSAVDLPDVQLYAESEFMKLPTCRVGPVFQDIEKAIEVIGRAKRPLILAGGGIMASEAWNELIQFAESLSIPVVTSAAAKPCIPTDHPLAVGGVGKYSRTVANNAAAKCDTYIVIGSNLGDHTTNSRQAPSSSAKVIHIDLDARVLGTSYREEVSIVSDAKLALKALIEAGKALRNSQKACPWADWVKEVQSMVASWKATLVKKAREKGAEGAINPYFVIAALNKVLGLDDVLVADTGYMGAYGTTCVAVKSPGRKYIHACGSLGWGLPASLGAQLAVRDKARVICLTGDGGIGYHVSDIETAVRYNLPVVVIVMNNSSLAFEYHIIKNLYKDTLPAISDFSDIDYGAVAKNFGAYGEKVRKPEDVERTLRRALDSGRPAVVDFATDKEIIAPVTDYERVEKRQL